MRIAWATDYAGIGNALGHTVGNREGRAAAISAGVEIDPDAEIAVHHCPPHCFKPIPGKVNILWFAWEFPEFTPVELEGIKRAEIVFVTAKFLLGAVEQAAPEVPAFYVPQGIRVDTFTYAKREAPVDRPFRFLWVGAPNDRKGWRHVMAAWHSFIDKPDCELYIKTTFASDALPGGRHAGNIIIDTARLSDAEMVAVYHGAHAFVFPSMGEGFGFTLGEAMATGLPCIYTPATGLADIATAQTAFPIAYTMKPCFDVDNLDGTKRTLTAAWPDVRDLVRQMRHVKRGYRYARQIGRRAARRIRKHFTWAQSGRVLSTQLEVVKDILEEVRS